MERQRQGLGVAALLVLHDALAQLLVDGLHHIVAAILLQRVAQRRTEGVFLLLGGQRRRHAEYRVDDLLVDLSGVFAVKQGVVDVGGAVIKGGEQESQLRRQRDVTGGRAVEAAVLIVVFQLQRRGFYRADAAQKVLEHRVGAVGKHLVVAALIGHIVGVGSQQDEIVGLAHVHGVDDAAVQGLPGVLILRAALPHGLKQAVLVAAGHLRRGKFDIDEVSAQPAGQSLFQQPQVHLLLLLGHESHGFVDIGDDLAAAVDVAAVDTADGIFIQLEAPAYLVELFLIHRCLLTIS